MRRPRSCIGGLLVCVLVLPCTTVLQAPSASSESESEETHAITAFSSLPNDTIQDDFEDADAGLDECVGSWGMPISPPNAVEHLKEMLAFRAAQKGENLMQIISRKIGSIFREPLAWNLQGAFLAQRLSSLMELRSWRRTCLVCASPVAGLGCRRVIARWLPKVTFPYYLAVVSLPNVFEDPTAQDVIGMRAPNGHPDEIANLCNFVIIVVERALHVIPLAVHNISIWSPLTSQVILVLDSAPWLLPGMTKEPPSFFPYDLLQNSGGIRDAMITMLQNMWSVRRAQRIAVYQTTRPARFMALDVLAGRTLSICAHDSDGIWDVLSRNITDLCGLPVRLTMFARRPTVVPLRKNTTIHTRLDKIVGYFGMDAWILETFALHLNFTPVVLGTTDGKTFGYNVNGNYTGTLKDLMSGYSDVAFNQHFILDYNSQDVLPSVPVDYDALCVVVPSGEILAKWAQMVQVFGFQVVLVFLLLSSMLVAFFYFLSINAPRRPTCNDSIFYMYAMLCGAPVVPQPKVCSQRMLIGCCALFGVLATNSLQSQMATMLSRTRPAMQMKTLEQLDESGLLIFTGSDSLRTTTFQGDNPLLQHLLTKVITPNNTTEFFRMTKSGRVARLNRRNSMRSTDESVYLLPECPREYFLGYLVPKCSPFLDPMNRLLSLLQSSGILNFFKDASYDAYHRHSVSSTEREAIRVKLADMTGPFYMLLSGHFTAIGALLGEQAVHRATAYLSRVWREWRARRAAPAVGRGRGRGPHPRRRRRRPKRVAAPSNLNEPSWIRPPRGPPPPLPLPPPPYSFVL